MAYNPLTFGQQVMASSQGVVIASNQSPVSVAGSLNIVGNPSISGTVNAISTNVGSVITVSQGSVATVIIGGSISATFTPPANQSVSGTIGASIIGLTPFVLGGSTNASVITVGQGSIATVIIGGSISATFTPPANQSVSGTVGASIVGQLPAGTAMIGSVATYQGSIPWTINSVYGNISGSVAAFQAGTRITSISGTVITSPGADTIPAISSILVGVTANTNGSVLTTTGYQMALMQITSGPGASITGNVNFEGTADGTQFVPIQGYNISNNVISSVATTESDWTFNVAGLQGMRARVSNWSVGSITARVNLSPEDARPLAIVAQGNQSVSGTVGASIIGLTPVSQGGTWIASTFGTMSVLGTVPVTQSGNWIVSVASMNITSIATTGGFLPVTGSVFAIQSGAGSVVTVFQAPSIVGTYAEDAASASGDKGFLVMGARNDTLSSVTSNDGDYSSHVVGPAGELIAANAPFTKWVQGNASMLGGLPVTGSLVPIIAAQGSSIFTYITGIQIANASATNAWITLLGGTNSVVGYTVAPANGGSNIIFPNALKTNANAAFSASISTVASVYLSAQGFIAKI